MKHLSRIILLSTVLVSAFGYGATMMGTGTGADSCQSWTDSIKTGGTEQFVYKTWVDGYLTAFNMSTILKNYILFSYIHVHRLPSPLSNAIMKSFILKS